MELVFDYLIGKLSLCSRLREAEVLNLSRGGVGGAQG